MLFAMLRYWAYELDTKVNTHQCQRINAAVQRRLGRPNKKCVEERGSFKLEIARGYKDVGSWQQVGIVREEQPK